MKASACRRHGSFIAQHIQRKHMAAGDVFKREQDEDERGDFQNPKREHRHRVGQEKLQQRCQHEGNWKRNHRHAARRRDKITAEAENENRQRNACHRDIRNAPGKKQAEPIPEIIHRLEQKLADVAFADVGGDLPVVFVHRRQHVHYGDHDVIKNHLRLGVAGKRTCAAFRRVNRAPEREHGEERDETEQRPRQVIEAIRQVVLDPDADDVQIFFHSR